MHNKMGVKTEKNVLVQAGQKASDEESHKHVLVLFYTQQKILIISFNVKFVIVLVNKSTKNQKQIIINMLFLKQK